MPVPEIIAASPKLSLLVTFEEPDVSDDGGKQLENLPPMEEPSCVMKDTGPPHRPTTPKLRPLNETVLSVPNPITV